MVAKTITRKKNPEIVKEELFKLVEGNWCSGGGAVYIQNIIDQREAIDINKCYEKIIESGNKKNPVRYEAIEEQMLKNFKEKGWVDLRSILKLDFWNV